MKAVIVAGGKGERLRPLTNTLPKPMLLISGKPILEHIISHFKEHGIREFIITLCYLPEKITEYFGDGEKFDVSIQYLFEEQPLGNAGNIAEAKKHINDTFIVTSADSLRDLNIQDMIRFHKRKKGIGTLHVYKHFKANPKSMVVIDSENRIKEFIERPKKIMDDFVWSNGFFIIFEPELFTTIPENTKLDFGKDIFPLLLSKNKQLFAYPTEGYFIDIGDISKLEQARKTY